MMRKSKTEKIVSEAKSFADQAAQWLSDKLDDAPDMDEIKEVVGDRAKDTLESARDRMEDLAGWFGEMAENLAAAVGEPPKEPKGKKVAGAVAAGAAVAGGLYFFNPTYGKSRRARIKSYFVTLRDRILGRLDEDSNVYVDGAGDLRTIDPDKVSGLEG
jgi:hypothetical protein